jgi:hypothetical protein
VTRTAQATRDRAAALDMKAKASKEIRTSPRQWRRLPERLQMLPSPIGWRLCSSANNLNTYTAGTDLRAPVKVAGERTMPNLKLISARRAGVHLE